MLIYLNFIILIAYIFVVFSHCYCNATNYICFVIILYIIKKYVYYLYLKAIFIKNKIIN